jgi:hypothetical protein
MIDTSTPTALLAPSAGAWLFDLDPVGGPQFVVFRLGSAEASRVLAEHLTDIGAAADEDEAREVVGTATVSSAGVVW